MSNVLPYVYVFFTNHLHFNEFVHSQPWCVTIFKIQPGISIFIQDFPVKTRKFLLKQGGCWLQTGIWPELPRNFQILKTSRGIGGDHPHYNLKHKQAQVHNKLHKFEFGSVSSACEESLSRQHQHVQVLTGCKYVATHQLHPLRGRRGFEILWLIFV